MKAVTRLPKLTASIVVRASAKAAKVYVGRGKRVTLRLGQVRWARLFRNENWRGRAPRRVTDAVAVGDPIRLRRNKKKTWELSQAPSVTGALVGLSPLDGAIRAVVGGILLRRQQVQPGGRCPPPAGFQLQTLRLCGRPEQGLHLGQPGSGRARFRQVRPGRAWRPRNTDHRNLGRIRMRIALTLSRNLASIHLLKQVGVEETRNYLQRFGFTLEELPRVSRWPWVPPKYPRSRWPGPMPCSPTVVSR